MNHTRVCLGRRGGLVAAVGALLVAATAGGVAFAQAGGDAETALRARTVTLDLPDAPLAKLLEAFAAQTGMPAAADPACAAVLAALGGDRFVARVKDAPALDALDVLLRGSGLAWRVADGRLTVGPAAATADEVITRAYPVADLLPGFAAAPVDPAADDPEEEAAVRAEAGGALELAELVRRAVAPGAWNGPGRAVGLDGATLWVTHTRAAHAEARALLEVLRGTPERRVEFRGALLDLPLDDWRGLAPAGARVLTAAEFEELLRAARNKGRLVREFVVATAEGECGRFDLRGLDVARAFLPNEPSEVAAPRVMSPWDFRRPYVSDRVACEFRPVLLGAGDRVLVGLRACLRRSAGWGESAGDAVRARERWLPPAQERRVEGGAVLGSGQAMAWRLGGALLREEGDRLLALVVRATPLPRTAAGAWSSPNEDAALAAARVVKDLKGAGPLDAFLAAAEAAARGVLIGPAARAALAHGRAGEFVAAPGCLELLRAVTAATGVEVRASDTALALLPAATGLESRVHRLLSPAVVLGDGPEIDSFDPTAHRRDGAGDPRPSFGGGAPRKAGPARPAAADRAAFVRAFVPAESWEESAGACLHALAGGRLLVRQSAAVQGRVAAAAETVRAAADQAIAVEADLLEIDGPRWAELTGEAAGATGVGLAIDAALARKLREGADRQKGLVRLLGMTWTALPGQATCATLRDQTDLGGSAGGYSWRAIVEFGLQLRVRVAADGDGHRLDVDGERAEPRAAGVDPSELGVVAIHGSGRVAAGGGLLFRVGASAPGAEEKVVLLLVSPSPLK